MLATEVPADVRMWRFLVAGQLVDLYAVAWASGLLFSARSKWGHSAPVAEAA